LQRCILFVDHTVKTVQSLYINITIKTGKETTVGNKEIRINQRVKQGCPISPTSFNILWYIDLLLGKGLEIDDETTAVAMQQRGKHGCTTVELLLGTVLCSCKSRTTRMETGLFSVWSVPRSYLEDSWSDPFICSGSY
jgi:hypothetical protein